MDIHPTIPTAAADDDDAGTGSCYTCRPIRPLGVVPLSIRIGRQLSPGQTLFFLLLLSPPFFVWLSCFSLDVVQQQTTQTDPAGILCIFFFHLFIGSSSKVTRILLCSAPTPAK
jgi:hypothetical protein